MDLGSEGDSLLWSFLHKKKQMNDKVQFRLQISVMIVFPTVRYLGSGFDYHDRCLGCSASVNAT
jgi:hypothetical protein